MNTTEYIPNETGRSEPSTSEFARFFCKPKPSKHPSKQVLWARRKRDWLYEQLGGKCKVCGCTDKHYFHLHHKPGTKTWPPTGKVGFVRSITLYVRDFYKGNLELRCFFCHYREDNHGRPPR